MLICKGEAEHTRISLATRVLNPKLGSDGRAGSPGICKGKKREHKAPQPKSGQNQKKKLDKKDAAKEHGAELLARNTDHQPMSMHQIDCSQSLTTAMTATTTNLSRTKFSRYSHSGQSTLRWEYAGFRTKDQICASPSSTETKQKANGAESNKNNHIQDLPRTQW